MRILRVRGIASPSGVTDSVEVVQSEQSLASANDQYITSLYNFNLAKLILARALAGY